MPAPVATYRLQLTPEFGFDAARERLDYLGRLGISDLYLSPIFEARPGSPHGYDVVDPTRVREELGGEAGFRLLAEAARERGMGVLVDFVPNHMAAAWENPWWRDVLRRGRDSEFACFFDIDWDRHAADLAGRVVLPILGRPLGEAIAAGEIRLARRDGEVSIEYFDRALPLASGTGEEAAVGSEGGARPAEGGDAPDEGARPEVLRALLGRQHWALVEWTDAGRLVNYRRFFTIADLVGVRVEDPHVFRAVHAGLARLVAEGLVTGVRVDHVDGLADPVEYLTRVGELTGAGDAGDARDARDVAAARPWIVVEKVLARHERLPAGWPCAGTTGYDFLGMSNGLGVDGDGLRRIEADYAEATGVAPSFREVARRTERRIAETEFAADLAAIARRLLPHARDDPRGADLEADDLAAALLAVTIALPVYRTYVSGRPLDDHDHRALEIAFAGERPGAPPAAYEVLWSLLTLELSEAALPAIRRWQQLSGAVMAKGVEDTAFYTWNPLISLNDVGSEPGEGAVTPEEFQSWCVERAERWPAALDATSTHDTKRSEDVRARIASLSWIPDRWTEILRRWRGWNAGLRGTFDGEPAPSPSREISLYQTLLGGWPADPAEVPAFVEERLPAYLVKALREAKVHSAWEAPATGYEAAVVEFARRILSGEGPFLADFLAFQREVAILGDRLATAWLVLKTCAPGVPDFYQGTEVPTLSLVDPDNRRPVDWARGEALLRDLDRPRGPRSDPGRHSAGDRDANPDAARLALTRRLLAFRRDRRPVFARGAHVPLAAEGPGADAAVAFARRAGDEWALAIALRDPRPGAAARAALRLPDDAPRAWHPVLRPGDPHVARDGHLPLADLLGGAPVTVLDGGFAGDRRSP